MFDETLAIIFQCNYIVYAFSTFFQEQFVMFDLHQVMQVNRHDLCLCLCYYLIYNTGIVYITRSSMQDYLLVKCVPPLAPRIASVPVSVAKYMN